MKRLLRIHLHGMKIAFFTAAAYRFDFFVDLLVSLAGSLLSPLMTVLIYHNGASIGDYSAEQVFLIQGIYLTATGFGSLFFFSIVNQTTYLAREGMLDILLLKPHSLLSVLIATSYNNSGLSNILGGLLLFGYAATHLPPASPIQWLLFFGLFVISLTVLLGFSVILAALGIVWVGNSRLFELYDSISRFASYPITIFQKTLRIILTCFLPVAMIGFLPAAVLMNLPTPWLAASVLCCFAFLGLSLLFWSVMIRRYTSSGG